MPKIKNWTGDLIGQSFDIRSNVLMVQDQVVNLNKIRKKNRQVVGEQKIMRLVKLVIGLGMMKGWDNPPS
jgi:hypothetical protein